MSVQQKQRLGRLALAAVLAAGMSSAAWGQEAPKVGVIDVVQLLEESAPGKQGLDSLKALQRQKKDELDAKELEIKDLRAQISEGQFSLAEEKLAEMKRQLESNLIDLQRSDDDARRELAKRQEEMLANIQALIMPVITEVGAEFGYTMIFNKFESGLVYASDAIDITPLVMERLNKAAEPEATPGS